MAEESSEKMILDKPKKQDLISILKSKARPSLVSRPKLLRHLRGIENPVKCNINRLDFHAFENQSFRSERKVTNMFATQTFDKIVSRAELRSNLIKLYESLAVKK